MCVALTATAITPSWSQTTGTIYVELKNRPREPPAGPWDGIVVKLRVESTEYWEEGTTDSNGIATFEEVPVEYDAEGMDSIQIDLKGKPGDFCAWYYFDFIVRDLQEPPAGEFSLTVASGAGDPPGQSRCNGRLMQPRALVSANGNMATFETNYYFVP
jgi:hypothetical protein